MRKITAKFTAVLLLFLFLEKAGMRLWIHDYLHSPLTSRIADGREKEPDSTTRNLYSAGCDCVDDFFLPLTSTENISFQFAAVPMGEPEKSLYKSIIVSPTCSGCRHRGPPQAS